MLPWKKKNSNRDVPDFIYLDETNFKGRYVPRFILIEKIMCFFLKILNETTLRLGTAEQAHFIYLTKIEQFLSDKRLPI